jgi:adenylate kinase family enzyme
MFLEHIYLSPVLILQILNHRLQEEDTAGGAVLDGGFRTVEETKNFASMLETTGRDFDVNVFFIRIPGWKAVDRTLGQRQRPDDTLNAVFSRLSAFYTGLGERMSYVRNHWNLHIIDGSQTPDTISQELISYIHLG